MLSYGNHFTPPVSFRLRNESFLLRLTKASQVEISSIMFFCVNWFCTQTSNFCLNSALGKWFKTVRYYGHSLAPGCATTTTMPVTCHFCDFMDLFDDDRT
ncbi:hypothetical protein TNCT_102151 [Trichonephila clavata]|uniref:Uncharacterized protein n=1 Tax=Trichonephila clavata TaxID=2740835 RepID=A0A8X6G415_TRICU|nr:hypothetical protein TNCT_102151 [Trichonephila clavata]